MSGYRQRRVKKVMGEYKRENPRTGTSTDRKQGVAVTLSEARKNKTGLMSA